MNTYKNLNEQEDSLMKTGSKTVHNNQEVLQYWNEDKVESMYDKNLLDLEIRLIKKRLKRNSKILDAGCGEGEGTIEYSKVPQVTIHAADFSETRLKKASKKLTKQNNVSLKKIDFLSNYSLDKDYDAIISQRFLINLMEWKLQQKVLMDFKSMLKKGGRLIMLEGSKNGVAALNKLRSAMGLKPIPIKWHNRFFNDKLLIDFMKKIKFQLVEEDCLGGYFLLTRGIRPYFEKELNWNAKFNKMAASAEIEKLLNFGPNCSRLKLWVFKKT